MRTGLSVARESIEKAKAKSSQTFTPTRGLNYFSFKDGEKKILRFLTDDLLVANFYEFVCGNDGRPHDFICSKDVFGEGTEDFVVKYGGKSFERGMSGPLIDLKPKERIVGIAVLRQEIPAPGGKGLRTIDHTENIEVGGKTYKSRWFGIVKQATGNFWNDLLYVAERYDDSLCLRDWEISREGSGLDTKYHFIALDPDPDLNTIEAVQDFYGYGKDIAPDDSDRFLFCPQTIPQWAEHYAGEERVKHWLAPKDGQPQYAPSGMDEFTRGDEAQAHVPQGTDFGSLKERLLRNK